MLTENDAFDCTKKNLKSLALEECTWLLMSSSKLSKYVVLAEKSLQDFMQNDQLEHSSPCVSIASIRQEQMRK